MVDRFARARARVNRRGGGYRKRISFFGCRESNLLIPAAARFFSLDASSGFCPLGGLHTILPLPILYGKYCKEGRGGNTILRNSVGDEGGGGQKRGVFANKS